MTAPTDVTASTKCWEGDYRTLLRADTIAELFGPLGDVARRQVVLNRIDDRAAAQQLADALVGAGDIDAYAWAEDEWPALAERLAVPASWFGPAWPYAVPELTELAICTTPVLAHLAGDVRLEPGEAWLPRATSALAGAAAVSPVSPSRIELARPDARPAANGWVTNHDFSDQCFVVRPAELLDPAVVRATHPANGRYPKPGGALTFEARVGSWLRAAGKTRLIDSTRGYLHPVGGVEGTSYAGLGGPPEHPLPPPVPGDAYPPRGSAPVTALVVARNAARTIGWTVASLSWCAAVVVVDQVSDDSTAERAAAAGATVRTWPRATVSGRAIIGQLAADLARETGNDWLLVVDADELVPPALARTLSDLATSAGTDGVEVARRSYLFGQRVRSRHYWPAYSLRMVRVGRAVFPWGVEAIREPVSPVPGATTQRVPASDDSAIVHLGAPDLHTWVAKHNDRSTLLARGTELRGNVSLRRAVKLFVVRYVVGRGWRDGRLGLRLAVLDSFGRWLWTEKSWDNVSGGATTVLATYDEIAAATVSRPGPRRKN